LSPGRGKDGELTDEEVREIRRRYRDEDITQRRLGDEYGVSKSMIGRIVRRESYTDIEDLSSTLNS